MNQKNTIFGVGPKLLVSTAAYFALALYAGRLAGLPPVAADPFRLHVAGASLLVAGGIVVVIALRTIFRVYRLGILYRQGLFAHCRHPLYAAFTLLVVPGFCLLANSWPVLTVPLFMYLAVRRLIREEERGLIAAFGEEYEQYKKEVNALFPKF